MNFNHYIIVLVFAASFISSTTINNFHALASGEMLEYAMTACKTLDFDNYMKCMKDHNILNLELIKKAWTAKDNESINYDELIRYVARFLASRKSFLSYLRLNNVTLYNECLKNSKIIDFFVTELLKISEDEVIDYQNFISDVYKSFIINARSDAPCVFGVLYLVDTEEFTSAISATVSLTAESLKTAMNNCKQINIKSEYDTCMQSQGIDDSYVLEYAFKLKDFSMSEAIFNRILGLGIFINDRKVIEAMNFCQNITDIAEYKNCLNIKGLRYETFYNLALQSKDVNLIFYQSIIIQATKSFIYSIAFQDIIGVPSETILIDLNYYLIPMKNLPTRFRAGPGLRTADYVPSRQNFEFYYGTTKIDRITYG